LITGKACDKILWVSNHTLSDLYGGACFMQVSYKVEESGGKTKQEVIE
jgi:hypothetical protein